MAGGMIAVAGDGRIAGLARGLQRAERAFAGGQIVPGARIAGASRAARA
jgi:hypothetical protein